MAQEKRFQGLKKKVNEVFSYSQGNDKGKKGRVLKVLPKML